MNETLDNVCKSLDELALLILKAYTDDRTLKEIWGWNNPAITRHDLSAMSSSLANRIRKANLDTLDDELEAMLNDIPRRLKSLHTDTIPHIFNGNAIQAVPAYIQTINWLSTALDPLLGWESLQDSKAMPAALARRLRAIQAELENIVHNKELLKEQIRLIQDATEAAESLPTDLQSLKEARKAINKLSTDSAKLYGKIDEKYGNATSSVKQIIEKEDEAKNLVEKCEDAYRITTTKGLAAAFDHRAHRLSESMWLWVLGLLCALVVGAYLGSDRIALLTNAVSEKEPHWSVIWMHLTLSLLSIGAPLWFAWLATKQIGQRFRLAEDYGYKASVAKAYEGYRKEAVRIDEAFEARLFSSALSRLEEPPLRLIENTAHGSPWHELIASEAFQKALNTVPELKDQFIEIAKSGFSKNNKIEVKDDTKTDEVSSAK